MRCNTTANTYHGLNFNAAQALTQVQDNIMQNQKYGLSLTNVASIGTQGAPSLPTNNQWLGSWAGNFKTMNQNQFSSAQNSKIYVPWGTALDPNGSSTVIATPGLMGQDNYFHVPFGSANTLLNSTYLAPSCRIGNGNNGNGNGNGNQNTNNGNGNGSNNNNGNLAFTTQEITLMETFVGNNGFSNGLTPNGKHIHKNHVFRQLKNNPTAFAGSTLLTSFYNQQQSTSLNAYWQIEEQLNQNNKTTAQGIINTLNNTAVVETNYKQFYNLYLKTKDSTFNASDSIALLNIANLCPYDEGGVVYQARALYNVVYDTYNNFTDNCSLNTGNRLFDNIVKENEQKDINVIFKSKLYPNPNSNNFNIETTNENEKTILIFDMTGKIIYSQKNNEQQIKLSNLGLILGTYLVKVIYEDNSFDIHRLIIE